MAYCYWGAFGCEKDYTQSLELALESSGMGSQYGQVALGELHYNGEGGLAVDFAQAAAFYRMAAAQGLDAAQLELGGMHHNGVMVTSSLKTTLKGCGCSSLLPPKDIL